MRETDFRARRLRQALRIHRPSKPDVSLFGLLIRGFSLSFLVSFGTTDAAEGVFLSVDFGRVSGKLACFGGYLDFAELASDELGFHHFTSLAFCFL